MKKIICIFLAVLLLLTGCQMAAPTETTVPEETRAIEELSTVPTVTIPIQTMPDLVIGGQEGDELAFSNSGKARIGYTGNRSYVRYITDLDQLPDEEALKGYDAAFFEKSALVIVVETVSSGSVELEIGGIYRNGDTATVKLNRTVSGDFGTSDMATWLLWAEVSRELDCNWVLEGGSKQPQGEKY